MKDILLNNIYLNDLLRAIDKVDFISLKNKSILVTGGLGLICSTVVDLLYTANNRLNLNLKIYVADINNEFFKERYGSTNISYLYYNAIEPLSFTENFDFIIHGAGLASPELYVKMPVETILSNFNGVLNLLNYSIKNNVKRLLYISSSEVYGIKSNDNPFIENLYGIVSIDEVRSSYAVAKRVSEMICKSFTSEYGLETVIVRPGHIYGPTASPKDQRVSSAFAFQAARGEKIELKSSGLQKRSYCYSVDCAVAILITLLNGKSGESYNIGHNEITTIREMATIIAKAGNVDVYIKEPTIEELKAFNSMNNSSLNNEKIKSIGYSDSFSVDEGLTHTVNIIKDIYY